MEFLTLLFWRAVLVNDVIFYDLQNNKATINKKRNNIIFLFGFNQNMFVNLVNINTYTQEYKIIVETLYIDIYIKHSMHSSMSSYLVSQKL